MVQIEADSRVGSPRGRAPAAPFPSTHRDPHMSMSQAKAKLEIEPATLKEIYRQISRIHAVDRAIKNGLSSGKFRFSYWPMTGQEAIPAALAPLLSARDYMVTVYRGIHDQVAKGVSLKGLFA